MAPDDGPLLTMQVDCALLCDSATIREQLLHVLGGGVTKLFRPVFPAPLEVELALMIRMRHTDAGAAHQLKVQVLDGDGARAAELTAEFKMSSTAQDGEAGYVLAPMVVPLRNIAIAGAGSYRIDVLIDEATVTSLEFDAIALEPPADLSGS